jgi:hypothetical protein
MVLEAGKSKIEGLATFKNLPVEERQRRREKKDRTWPSARRAEPSQPDCFPSGPVSSLWHWEGSAQHVLFWDTFKTSHENEDLSISGDITQRSTASWPWARHL